MSAAANHVDQIDMQKIINRLTTERDQALRAEEDAVELVFQLQEAMRKIEAMANQAANLAGAFNLKSEITAIARLAGEMKGK